MVPHPPNRKVKFRHYLVYVANPFHTLLLEDQSSKAFLESNSTVLWFFFKELHLSQEIW